jgi:uncharacterized protein involved in response to NO
VSRLCANLIPANARDFVLVGSALAWSAAFVVYLAVYAPYLCRARIDGREG